MLRLRYWAIAIGVVSLLFFSLQAAEETLQENDIHQIMDQIFSEHVNKKSMTGQIMHQALLVYIDQFDPHRMYLLKEEVIPYVNLSQREIDQAIGQYQKNDYSFFKKLNTLIQQAILRSRNIRKELLLTDSFFEVKEIEKRDPGQKGADSFPSTIDQLKERVLLDFTVYFQVQNNRIGGAITEEKKERILRSFEARLRDFEDQYLYQDIKGNPFPALEAEHLFTIHVLKALANSLDAHTSFYEPGEAYDIRVRLQKEFQGIGLVLKETPNGILVTHMLQGGPAETSKLIQIGDIMTEVDGKSVLDEPFEKVMDLLHGEKNTTIQLTFKRLNNKGEEEKVYHVELKRELIILNNDRVDVNYQPFGDGIVGDITLHSFYQGDGVSSEVDVRKAIEQLESKGKLRGLILDLRENSGGFLSQAVKVAGLFISNGVIVISKYSNGEERFYRDVDSKIVYDGPLIVLTSKATASAAEIVAQALQDYGVALVVGDEHTYGKGTIQTQTLTDKQSTSYFKVTVGKYYTVSGHTPQKEGVKADILVPSHWNKEEIGESYLDSVESDTIPSAYHDQLQDVSSDVRPWYLKYYVPHIQRKIPVWRELIPNLKKNSEYRIKNNKNYQFFLKGAVPGSDAELGSDEEDWDSPLKNKTFGEDDLQTEEAYNILKDMILLHAKEKKVENKPG